MVDIRIRAYEFSKQVVLFLNCCEIKRLHYPIIHQMLRSSTSICANIIEARAGNSKKHLISYYTIALRSANETHYWMKLIIDTMNVDVLVLKKLLIEVSEISKILAQSIITLKKQNS